MGAAPKGKILKEPSENGQGSIRGRGGPSKRFGKSTWPGPTPGSIASSKTRERHLVASSVGNRPSKRIGGRDGWRPSWKA